MNRVTERYRKNDLREESFNTYKKLDGVDGIFSSIVHDYGKSFSIGKFFCLVYTKGLFWFRFFGAYGLHGKHKSYPVVLFSERNGYKKYFKIFGWKFRILKPNKT